MHQAGRAIIEDGFCHVVEIINEYIDGEIKWNTKSFLNECAGGKWKDYQYKITPADGELMACGSYVFFEDPAGAIQLRILANINNWKIGEVYTP